MNQFKRVLTSQVTAVCIVVFLGDVATGFVSPTFSLFTEQLGISLTLLGLINTVAGLTSLMTSIPFGSLSDKTSRPRMIQIGMLAFAAGLSLLAQAGGPLSLFAGRIMLALGMVLVFRISAAHLGDVTIQGGRSLAFAAYATALGLGFTIGSLLGGQFGDSIGIANAYWIAAGAGLAGMFIALRFVNEPHRELLESQRGQALLRGLGRVARNRELVLVSAGNLLISLTFTGAITTFFPIYGEDLGLSPAIIGTMFAIRGLVSTLGRVPNGVIARIFGNRAVMITALLFEIVVMLGLWLATQQLWLTLFLALEGLAFGGYLVASQTFIADTIEADIRGAAIGFNATASGIGSTAAPLTFGLVAETWGVKIVFPVTAACLALGVAAILVMTASFARQASALQETSCEPNARSSNQLG